MKLTAENVLSVMHNSLFDDAEVAHGRHKTHGKEVRGVIVRFILHEEVLETHRADVASMLLELPEVFEKGMSFLAACNTREGVVWGDHRHMEALFVLAIGLGLASYPLPPEHWDMLPGGMPYVIVNMEACRNITQGAVA